MIDAAADRPQRASSVVRKVVVTAVSAGPAYLITNLLQNDQAAAVTLSVLIGGVALILQFLVEFETRLSTVEHGQSQHATQVETALLDHGTRVEEGLFDHVARVEAMVDARFSAIDTATRLYRQMESSGIGTAITETLVQRLADITPQTSPLVRSLAEAELIRISEFVKSLGEGREATYEGEDRDWLLGLTRHASRSIDATSLSTVDGGIRSFSQGLWSTDLGLQYLEAQGEAVRKRNVRIRRLFVLDQPDARDYEELDALCRQQQAYRIDVRTLEPSQVSEPVPVHLMDFIVFDGIVSYESVTAARPKDQSAASIVNTRLVLRAELVYRKIQAFDRLWELADRADNQAGRISESRR